MSWISRGLSLLDIHEQSLGVRGGRSMGGGGGGARNVQGFADKSQLNENSSIGQHQRQILQQQVQEKRMDQAGHLYNKENGHDAWKGLSEKEKQQQLDKYDAEGKIKDPTQHSNDANRQAAGQKQAEKDAARQAMKDYVKEQEQKAEKAGKDWKHDDAEKARNEWKDKQEQAQKGNSEVKPEDQPHDYDKDLKPNEGDPNDPNNQQTIETRVTNLENWKQTTDSTIQNHESRIAALEAYIA